MLGHKHELARMYLSEITTVEKTYRPVWVAYRHLCSAESEHDQAMVAYFIGVEVMKGSFANALHWIIIWD